MISFTKPVNLNGIELRQELNAGGVAISKSSTRRQLMATGRVPTTANSPLTAKGDLFGYSTTQARVAVGNNGETLVADSSTSTGLRWQGSQAAGKNFIINGGFDMWQRGTSFSAAANTSGYYADRWMCDTNPNQASTFSRQVTGDTTNLPNIQYCIRFQRNSGQTGTNIQQLVTSLETVNSIPLAGRTVTLSFYARAGANYSPTSNALVYRLSTGTGTDQNALTVGYTGLVNAINETATLTTTWQRFTATATIATNATEAAVTFRYSPTGTAGANDYFEVTGVQVEVGSVATQFSRAAGTIQGELAACQRYYERINATSIYAGFGSGFCNGTTTGQIFLNYQTTKRTQPSGAVSAAGDFLVTITGDNKTVSGVSFDQFANNGVYMSFTVTGLTAGQGCVVRSNNKTTSYIELSSEL
jgi:hypothetical protein